MGDTTRQFYDTHVQEYAAVSATYDLTSLWDAFAQRVPPGSRVLDAGCGTGRDMIALSRRGYVVEGLDYSAPIAEYCRQQTGLPVTVADLRQPVFPPGRFGGIWCLATLLHIPRRDIDDVLRRLHDALQPGGILLTSMQKGSGSELAPDGRLFERYEPEEWVRRLQKAGFQVELGPVTTLPSKRAVGGQVTWFVTYSQTS
jgi:SAM-dependent methyltransferase